MSEKLLKYHRNLGTQLIVLKDQVRNLIANKHWLSDGEYKELILRKTIRNHIGSDYHIGSGFVVTRDSISTQIDILITKKSSPTLFQDGDFKIVTPDTVSAIIEVKSRQTKTTIKKAIAKLVKNSKKINIPNLKSGLFLYEYGKGGPIETDLLNSIITKELFENPIHWICLGKDYFIRYWPIKSKPAGDELVEAEYRLYNLADMAYSYFISNTVLDTNQHTNYSCEYAWFPLVGGKEQFKVSSLSLKNLISNTSLDTKKK